MFVWCLWLVLRILGLTCEVQEFGFGSCLKSAELRGVFLRVGA